MSSTKRIKLNKSARIVIIILLIAILIVVFKLAFSKDTRYLSNTYGIDFPRDAKEVKAYSVEVNGKEINYYKYNFRNLRDMKSAFNFSATNKVPSIYYDFEKHSNLKKRNLPDVENTVYFHTVANGSEIWVLLNEKEKEVYVFEK